jgi:hypothetical protein
MVLSLNKLLCVVKVGYVCAVLVGKLEGKISLGRPRRRWENKIKTILKKQDRRL